jgi:hypothetical protein
MHKKHVYSYYYDHFLYIGKKRTGVTDFVESLQANTLAMNAKTVYMCIYIYIYMHVYIFRRRDLYIYTYTYTYIYMYICIYIGRIMCSSCLLHDWDDSWSFIIGQVYMYMYIFIDV